MTEKEQYKGEELERMSCCYLWNLGYIAHSNLKIQVEKENRNHNFSFQDVTDIDAFGLNYNPIFRVTTFFIDCKHHDESLFKQILRCYGIQRLFNISDFLILRSSVPDVASNFSSKNNFRIQSNQAFLKQVKDVKYGYCGKDNYYLKKRLINELSKAEIDFRNRLYSNFFHRNPFEQLKAFIRISKDYENKSPVLDFELFELTCMVISHIATKTVHLFQNSKLRYTIQKKLIGNLEFKKKISSIIGNIKQEIVPLYDEESLDNSDFLPPFSNALIDLLENIIFAPNFIQPWLRYNNFCIHQFGLINDKINHDLVKENLSNFDLRLFSDWNLKVLTILNREKISTRIIELLT